MKRRLNIEFRRYYSVGILNASIYWLPPSRAIYVSLVTGYRLIGRLIYRQLSGTCDEVIDRNRFTGHRDESFRYRAYLYIYIQGYE